MSIPTAVSVGVGVASAAAAAMYADARWGVSGDVYTMRAMLSVLVRLKYRQHRGRPSIYHFFEDTMARQPNDVAYVYAGQQWTWHQVQQREPVPRRDLERDALTPLSHTESRQVAHYLLSLGLQPGCAWPCSAHAPLADRAPLQPTWPS